MEQLSSTLVGRTGAGEDRDIVYPHPLLRKGVGHSRFGRESKSRKGWATRQNRILGQQLRL